MLEGATILLLSTTTAYYVKFRGSKIFLPSLEEVSAVQGILSYCTPYLKGYTE